LNNQTWKGKKNPGNSEVHYINLNHHNNNSGGNTNQDFAESGGNVSHNSKQDKDLLSADVGPGTKHSASRKSPPISVDDLIDEHDKFNVNLKQRPYQAVIEETQKATALTFTGSNIAAGKTLDDALDALISEIPLETQKAMHLKSNQKNNKQQQEDKAYKNFKDKEEKKKDAKDNQKQRQKLKKKDFDNTFDDEDDDISDVAMNEKEVFQVDKVEQVVNNSPNKNSSLSKTESTNKQNKNNRKERNNRKRNNRGHDDNEEMNDELTNDVENLQLNDEKQPNNKQEKRGRVVSRVVTESSDSKDKRSPSVGQPIPPAPKLVVPPPPPPSLSTPPATSGGYDVIQPSQETNTTTNSNQKNNANNNSNNNGDNKKNNKKNNKSNNNSNNTNNNQTKNNNSNQSQNNNNNNNNQNNHSSNSTNQNKNSNNVDNKQNRDKEKDRENQKKKQNNNNSNNTNNSNKGKSGDKNAKNNSSIGNEQLGSKISLDVDKSRKEPILMKINLPFQNSKNVPTVDIASPPIPPRTSGPPKLPLEFNSASANQSSNAITTTSGTHREESKVEKQDISHANTKPGWKDTTELLKKIEIVSIINNSYVKVSSKETENHKKEKSSP
jgi:hypothetical protein